MSRKAKTRHEVMYKIISERQPMKLHILKAYAACYLVWKDASKNEMYQYVRENFNVSVDGWVTI